MAMNLKHKSDKYILTVIIAMTITPEYFYQNSKLAISFLKKVINNNINKLLT